MKSKYKKLEQLPESKRENFYYFVLGELGKKPWGTQTDDDLREAVDKWIEQNENNLHSGTVQIGA